MPDQNLPSLRDIAVKNADPKSLKGGIDYNAAAGVPQKPGQPTAPFVDSSTKIPPPVSKPTGGAIKPFKVR